MICDTSPLLTTVMVLLKFPGLPAELYNAVTLPVFPGMIGSLDHSGVVQPHDG